MNTWKYAGGYRVIRGSKQYPNLTATQRRPWLASTRSHLKRKLKANDHSTLAMLADATARLGSCVASSPNRSGCGKVGNPATRAATILAYILKQGKYSALDILAAALAAQLQCAHDYTITQPIPSDYFRSVQVGRAVHHLLRSDKPVMRVFDDGKGNTGERAVQYVRLQLQSRYVCQQLQRILCEEIGFGFVRKEGQAVADLVNRATARKLNRLND